MSDTKKCKHCQSDIPKKAKVCPACRKKQKNPLVTTIGVLLIIFGLMGMLSATSDDSSTESNSNNSSVQDETNTTTTTKTLTVEKFNSIDFGMSYEDVVAIVGEEGELASEASVGDITSSIYQWEEGMTNFNATFQNNELIGKAQIGIITSSTEVTLEMFNSIENGMTYDEVVATFGGDGAFLSNSKVMAMVTEIYMWPGTSLGANCNITFQDGKVIAKAQVGLE